MALVIADPRFLNPDRLAELAEEGAEANVEMLLADCVLGEPAYGELVLGPLTYAEARLFKDLYDATALLEDMTRTLIGQTLASIGNSIRTSDRKKSIEEQLTDKQFAFADEEEAKTFFRLQKKVDMLHACFHFHVAERFGTHDHKMGVRSKARAVRLDRRY
jgi:hypothetical protein